MKAVLSQAYAAGGAPRAIAALGVLEVLAGVPRHLGLGAEELRSAIGAAGRGHADLLLAVPRLVAVLVAAVVVLAAAAVHQRTLGLVLVVVLIVVLAVLVAASLEEVDLLAGLVEELLELVLLGLLLLGAGGYGQGSNDHGQDGNAKELHRLVGYCSE